MTVDCGFDSESVYRYMMTNFDVKEEDNRDGSMNLIFSSHGASGHGRRTNSRTARRLSQVPVVDMTILQQLYNACLAVIYKRRQRAAVFIAHFIKHCGHAVKQFSFRDDLRDLVLQAVLEVAARKESFSLLTRELVLQTSLEYPMFTHADRKRLMERLATMNGDAIWSSSESFLNYPVQSLEEDKTEHTSAESSDPFTFAPPQAAAQEVNHLHGYNDQIPAGLNENPLSSSTQGDAPCSTNGGDRKMDEESDVTSCNDDEAEEQTDRIIPASTA